MMSDYVFLSLRRTVLGASNRTGRAKFRDAPNPLESIPVKISRKPLPFRLARCGQDSAKKNVQDEGLIGRAWPFGPPSFFIFLEKTPPTDAPALSLPMG